MPKKMNLNLNELKVQSFVTSLEEEQKDDVKAGGETRNCPSGQYSGCPCTQQTDCNQYTCNGTCYYSCVGTCITCNSCMDITC